jgi:hypothetical protein
MSNDIYEEIIGHVPETYPDFDTVPLFRQQPVMISERIETKRERR